MCHSKQDPAVLRIEQNFPLTVPQAWKKPYSKALGRIDNNLSNADAIAKLDEPDVGSLRKTATRIRLVVATRSFPFVSTTFAIDNTCTGHGCRIFC